MNHARWLPLAILGCLLALPAWDAAAQGIARPQPLAGRPLPPGSRLYRAGEAYRPQAQMAVREEPTPARTSSIRGPGPADQEIYPVSADVPMATETYADPNAPSMEMSDMEGAPMEGWSDDTCCANDGFATCSPETIFCGSGRTPWSIGIEFTFLKPHFESNVAFTRRESNGGNQQSFTDVPFNFDTELAPRVWIESLQCQSLGIRAVYWQFDHSAPRVSGSPPANGFGRIIPPDFGGIDLSTSVPGAVYAAEADINAYSVDLEMTKNFDCGPWGWLASAGLRYGEAKQGYRSTLRNEAGAVQGNVNYSHSVKGIGPTISLRTQRPFTPQLALFGMTRGSLLFGDGESSLLAVEDQDQNNALTTRRNSSRDDILPIGEAQVGLQWMPPCQGMYHPYLHIALEGQLWQGAGNSSTEDGNLGFFGFNVALGVDW